MRGLAGAASRGDRIGACSRASGCLRTGFAGRVACLATRKRSDDRQPKQLPHAEPWPQAEIARREKAAVGFYLSTHPLDNYGSARGDEDQEHRRVRRSADPAMS